jgi:hypothetical protein
MTADNANWWRTGIIYQIYPRSFQDSNEDGVGDIAGVIQRLPYLVELGIDAIWLSPIFTSPMADFGYDIANYTDVDPLFGSIADLDRLISAAHRNRSIWCPITPQISIPGLSKARPLALVPDETGISGEIQRLMGLNQITGCQSLEEVRGSLIAKLANIFIIRFSQPNLT